MLLARAEGTLEPEVLHLRSLAPAGGVAVDVGANWGMYSYALSQIASKVYAFEVNADLTADLARYRESKIQVINSGLSSAAADKVLHVPVSESGFVMSGWGTLDASNLPPNAALIKQIAVQVKPLDEFGLANVVFMKINVEGHEVEVLAGASETIRRWRPVVLVEVADRNLETVHTYFEAADYRTATLTELAGVTGSEQNHIYIPRESQAGRAKQGNGHNAHA